MKVAEQRIIKRNNLNLYVKEYQNKFSMQKCGQNYAKRLSEINSLNED